MWAKLRIAVHCSQIRHPFKVINVNSVKLLKRNIYHCQVFNRRGKFTCTHQGINCHAAESLVAMTLIVRQHDMCGTISCVIVPYI